jgi:hypothetical protein
MEFNGYLYATVEGVNYKVDTSELFSDRVWSDRVNTGSWKASLFLHFPVGTLSITPNREDLIYNPHTIATLETAYEAAIRTITHDIQDRVNQCATYNDACKQTYQLRTRFSSITKNPPTFKHPSRPNEELSRFVYITIPDDTHIGHLKKVKYGRGRDGNLTHDGWQDKQELRIDLAAENTTLLWCPEKTPHLRERLKTLTARRNVLYLLLKGPNKDAIINLLTQELPQSFDIEDLSTIQYYQRPRTVATKKVPTLTGRITTSDIDPDRAFKVIKDPCGAIRYNDTTYTTYEIDYLRCTLDTFNDYQRIQDIVLLPDNAKNSKLAKQLTDFLPIAHGRIEALLAAHKETLIAYQLKEKVFGHAHIPYHWRYDQQRLDSPLFKGIRKYLTLNDDKPERLIHAARLLNLSSPSPSPTALEEAQTFYDKYKVFFETPIDLENAPILLTAYDFYLEHHTPC